MTSFWLRFWLLLFPASVLLIRLEIRRAIRLSDSDIGLIGWLFYWDIETTVPCVLFVTLVVALLLRHKRHAPNPDQRSTAEVKTPHKVHGRTAFFASTFLVASISFLSSWQIGQSAIPVVNSFGVAEEVCFADLPPGLHDEHSYLLQAKTYRSARLSWPAVPTTPALFHQFHVLNDPVTVSRYFPLTGLWMAPWSNEAAPVMGHWVAGAISAVCFYWSALLMTRRTTALLCGLLIAASPGLAIFSNMLLAHHPTMLMLSVFLLGFLLQQRSGKIRWSVLSGFGLAAAMLARPVTAAGFGAPFGVYLLFQLIRGEVSRKLILAYAVPLLTGFSALAVCNHAATGSYFRTAYQEYTDTFTPRHRFGFGNGLEPASENGPDAVRKYDEWATNLTLETAVSNVVSRLFYSHVWSAGLVLIGVFVSWATLTTVASLRSQSSGRERKRFASSGVLLLLAAVVSLHLVHVPYWFDGILHWHYVFETAPLLLILTGVGLADCVDQARKYTGPIFATFWAGCLVAATFIPAWYDLSVFGGSSKVSVAISEQSYARVRLEQFRRLRSKIGSEQPSLILVDESLSNPQLSYIINAPDYSDAALVCRLPETAHQFRNLKETFDQRRWFVFSPESFALQATTPDDIQQMLEGD